MNNLLKIKPGVLKIDFLVKKLKGYAITRTAIFF